MSTEYRQAHPSSIDTVLTQESVHVPGFANVRFVCSLTIPEAPSTPFGTTSKSFTFSNKKDAKKYAAKLAVEWLINNQYMPSIDQVKSAKPATVASVGKTITVLGEQSWSKKVRDLAEELGYPPPRYDITQNPAMDSMYSGYAYFHDTTTTEGKYGEFSNIFGRKSAKEQCAKDLYEFLEKVKEQRLSQFGPGGVSIPLPMSKKNRGSGRTMKKHAHHRKGPYDRVDPRTNSVTQNGQRAAARQQQQMWPNTPYSQTHQQPYSLPQYNSSSYHGAPHVSVPPFASQQPQTYSASFQPSFGPTYPNALSAAEQAQQHRHQQQTQQLQDHTKYDRFYDAQG